ncbi:MAG: exopolysaccharide biosynthesis protein exod [Salinisphaeraceae bacterium]|jgi:hypothetical protein|nr:exopolysaccharide biosynthesis protein exod [Salinisphaeraceae bacterium]
MNTRQDTGNLVELLDTLDRNMTGSQVAVDDMIAAIRHRGFGPLIILPALIAMMPTGALPGVPTTMALINACICLQLVFGRDHPWVPGRLGRLRISRERFDKAQTIARPWARRIDRFLHPRLTGLTTYPAPRFIALASLLLGLTMIPLELLPFAAAVPASAIVLLGLGLSVRDGLLILLAALLAGGGFAMIAWLS